MRYLLQGNYSLHKFFLYNNYNEVTFFAVDLFAVGVRKESQNESPR